MTLFLILEVGFESCGIVWDYKFKLLRLSWRQAFTRWKDKTRVQPAEY